MSTPAGSSGDRLPHQDFPFPKMEDFSTRTEGPDEDEIQRVTNLFKGLVHSLIEARSENPGCPPLVYSDQVMFVKEVPKEVTSPDEWLVNVVRGPSPDEPSVKFDIVYGGIQAISISRYQERGSPPQHKYELGASDDTVRRFHDTTGQSRLEIEMEEIRELQARGIVPHTDEDYHRRRLAEGEVRDQSRLDQREAGTNDQPIKMAEMLGLAAFFKDDTL